MEKEILHVFHKAFTQYNSDHLPPVIKIGQLSLIFLQLITIYISKSTCWNNNESINMDKFKKNDEQVNSVTDISRPLLH